jgi:hypothetical protein
MKSGKKKTKPRFRKTCKGCITEARVSKCYIQYKDMLKCPCKNCIVKVTCEEYCDEFHRIRLREQLKNERAMSGMFKNRKVPAVR